MSAPWYDQSGVPSTSSALSSAAIRGELNLIENSFDLLPAFTGNGNKILQVNVGESAIEATNTITLTGKITGTTLNATGDTAAGDNAAMGFTAAEGLILTGQGTTNDLTFKNDADASVMHVLTGTTGLVLDGALTATNGGSLTGTWTDLGTVTTIDINGGSIDGTTIGASATATIAGTTGAFSGILSSAAFTSTVSGSAVGITIANTGTGNGLFINQDGNGSALVIDSEAATTTTLQISSAATTSDVINIETSALTEGNAFDIPDASVLTSGRVARFRTNSSAFTGTNVDIIVDNASASGTALQVFNNGTGNGIFLDQNGNGIALNIDSESTSSIAINIAAASTTATGVINVVADALTIGKIASFASNSASTNTRDLVNITNDNTLATGTTSLSIKQDSTGSGIFVDQNGNGIALNIDTEMTTSTCLQLDAAVVTTGRVIDSINASASFTGAGSNFFNVSNAAATGRCVYVAQAGIGDGLFIDQDGNGVALNIDSEATTARTINVQSDAATSGDIARLFTNSASFSGAVLRAVIDNTGATGEAIRVQQDGTGAGIFLDQNGNGIALNVDNAGTGNGIFLNQDGNGIALNIDSEATTVRTVNVQSDAATSGDVTRMITNSATFSGVVLRAVVDNTGATGEAIRAQQDGTGTGIFIDQNGNGTALNIDSEATTATTVQINSQVTTVDVINIDAGSITQGNILDIPDCAALTTGRIARFRTNSSGFTGTAVDIIVDNASASGRALQVVNDGTGNGVLLDQNGNGVALNIDSEATTAASILINSSATTATSGVIDMNVNSMTTGNGINITGNALTTGILAHLFTDSSVYTSAFGIFRAHIDNTSASGNGVVSRNDGTGNAVLIDQNGNGIALNIDSEATSAIGIQLDASLTSAEAMKILKGTTDGGFFNFDATADGDTTSAISTLTTSGATTHHVQVEINGTKAWIAVSTTNPS